MVYGPDGLFPCTNNRTKGPALIPISPEMLFFREEFSG